MSAKYHSNQTSSSYVGEDSTGTMLRKLMKEKGISQYKLAEKSGVDVSTIRRMCNGDYVGYFHSWAHVLKALGADANDFLK